MAITLGTLLVELKANTAQFLEGMTKAATNTRAFGRDIQVGLSEAGELFAPFGPMGEKLASVFATVGSASRGALAEISKSGLLVGGLTGLTGGLAALGGSLFEVANHAAEVGSKIFEASEKTGIAASQMSGIMAIARETGVDFDSLASSLAKAGVNLQKAIIDSGGEAGKVLSVVMGGSANLLAERLRPLGDRLQDVLHHIFEINNVGERNLALSVLLGKSWQDNVAALKLLAEEGFGRAIDRAHQLGIYFDQDGAEAARKFKVAMNEITGELSGVSIAFGQKVIPYMQAFLQHVVSTVPYLEALGLRVLAIDAAMTGVGIPIAIKMWNEAGEKFKEVDQIETDFLDRINKLTKGEQANADATDKLSKVTKAHADALAELITREREQLSALDSASKPVHALALEYSRTTDEIAKAVAAGGSYAESLIAQALAADIFKRKLMEIPAVIPKLPDVSGYDRRGFNRFDAPNIAPTAPYTPPDAKAPSALTLSQQLATRVAMDSTRGVEKALREETELSAASFKKLEAVFPNLTDSMLANSLAGRQMIDQLTKMDKIGTLSEQFRKMTDDMIDAGENFSGNILAVMGKTFDQVEDKLAEAMVKGRVNLRDLAREMEEGLAKAAIQKEVSSVLQVGLSKQKSPSNADGSQGKPFYVVLVNAVKQMIGGLTGQGIAKPPAPAAIDKGLAAAAAQNPGQGEAEGASGQTASVLTKFLSPVLRWLQGIGGAVGGLFGGFRAGGGDVEPGKAYVVGERRRELFVPKQAGTILPSVPEAQAQPVARPFLPFHPALMDALAMSPERQRDNEATAQAIRMTMIEINRSYDTPPRPSENLDRIFDEVRADIGSVNRLKQRPIEVHVHVNNPTDVDNFKRSQSQIMSEAARAMERALARSRG